MNGSDNFCVCVKCNIVFRLHGFCKMLTQKHMHARMHWSMHRSHADERNRGVTREHRNDKEQQNKVENENSSTRSTAVTMVDGLPREVNTESRGNLASMGCDLASKFWAYFQFLEDFSTFVCTIGSRILHFKLMRIFLYKSHAQDKIFEFFASGPKVRLYEHLSTCQHWIGSQIVMELLLVSVTA